MNMQTHLLSSIVFNLPLSPPVGFVVAALILSNSMGSSFEGRAEIDSGVVDAVGGGSLGLDAPEGKSDAMNQ